MYEKYEKPRLKALVRMVWGAFRWNLLLAAVLIAGAVWLKAWWPLIMGIVLLLFAAWLFWFFWLMDGDNTEGKEEGAEGK